ncbi:hypothetical protein CRG98_006148 [Punica granatum]|uniref:Uncharacterized protein n=1 Tax=Punica granatum TaxID=22663 RepID=A0A2I0KYB2_PUNGR|nr:hypothetical protein CRG98_006148 [Punica granatum]
MSLKAADIPTWADLSSKFIDQYKYCAETPPTLLELSTMEITEDQGFEAHAVKWRARAAKHVPPISEAQQIQLFHSTLKGAYYLHMLAHTSSFSNLIDAGKKLDIGVKLDKIKGPAEKKEGESAKKAATGTPSAGNRRGRDASVNAVNSGCQATQQYSINYTPAPPATQAYAPPPTHYQQQLPAQQVYYSTPPAPQLYAHNYAPAPPPIQQGRPSASRTPQPVQRAPAPQDQQGIAPWHKQFTLLPAPLSHIYRQPLASNRIRSISPNPDFDPTIHDQSRRCEYHQGAPGHTTDNSAHAPNETAPYLIEETVGSIFSNNISFSDDELPSEGYAHSRALYIVCKCNNFVVGRVMIDNSSAPNVCHVSTLKQMNVDLNLIRLSKTAVRAFDGSWREVNGEIDLLIEVGPCSFSVTFRVLDISNAFSLLLGRPWIHSMGAVPSTLHQKLKFIVEEGLHHGINRPIEIEEYKNRRGHGFRHSCHEIIEARRGKHLHRLAAHYGKINRGIPVLPLSHFFSGPQHIVGGTLDGPSSDSDDALVDLPGICAVTEETPSGAYIRLAQENVELNNWTSVPCYSVVIADVLHSNPNLRRVNSNPSKELLEEPQPIYFGEGFAPPREPSTHLGWKPAARIPRTGLVHKTPELTLSRDRTLPQLAHSPKKNLSSNSRKPQLAHSHPALP